jgi:hypothetical protein
MSTTLRDILDAMTPNAGQSYDQLLDMPIFVKQNEDEDDDTVLGVILGYEDLTVTVDVGGYEYESILLAFDGNTIGGIVHD